MDLQENILELDARLKMIEKTLKDGKKKDIYIDINPNFFITMIFVLIMYYILSS